MILYHCTLEWIEKIHILILIRNSDKKLYNAFVIKTVLKYVHKCNICRGAAKELIYFQVRFQKIISKVLTAQREDWKQQVIRQTVKLQSEISS